MNNEADESGLSHAGAGQWDHRPVGFAALAAVVTAILVAAGVNLALEMGRASKDCIRRASEQ